MIILFRLLFKKDFFYTYSHWAVFLFQIASITVGLSVFWFTSEALDPAFQAVDVGFGDSYFNYIFLGEILIFLPMALFSDMSSTMRYWVNEGMMDDILLAKRSLPVNMILGTLSGLGKEAVYYFLMLLVAVLFFSFPINLTNFLLILLFHVFVIPLSLGLGMIAASALMIFGRGDAVVAQFTSVLTVVSGVYFPLKALPEFFQNAAVLSPYTLFVETGRSLFANGWTMLVSEAALVLAAVGLFVLLLGILSSLFAQVYVRRSGGMPLLRF